MTIPMIIGQRAAQAVNEAMGRKPPVVGSRGPAVPLDSKGGGIPPYLLIGVALLAYWLIFAKGRSSRDWE